MAKKNLSKLSDEEYKLLSPQELMMYNVTLPEVDYENQYSYKPFPKTLYREKIAADGSRVIQSAEVKGQKEMDRLGKDWKETLAAFGVETAPAKPEIAVQSYEFKVPAKDAEALSAPAGT